LKTRSKHILYGRQPYLKIIQRIWSRLEYVHRFSEVNDLTPQIRVNHQTYKIMRAINICAFLKTEAVHNNNLSI